ncbi:MAG: NAD(P)-dependent alcohol dehydrogenase [Phyllobacteriaceae bacterium]|nr:NAD(P)-dependent alcohol dehydrogenase [Phyllobacteriaceae bacterium]
MRAAVATAYGPPEVVKLVEVPEPVAGPGDILVRIHAASVSAGDWRLRSGKVPTGFGLVIRLMFGWRKLRQPVLGTDFSGVVETVGEGVTRFKPGDAVFGSSGFKMGCHAEFRVFPQTASIAAKPENLSHAQAAALPFGGQTALTYLRDKAALKSGERVLVVGASGAVGSATVQIAKALGAHVTGVCSARNADLVRSLGADAVVAYDKTDLMTLGQRFDVIVDAVGDPGYRGLEQLLTEQGRFLAIVAGLPEMLRAAVVNMSGGRRLIVGDGGEGAALVSDLAGMAATGVLRPVIDSVHSFADIVRAHARVDTRRKVGAVIVEMVFGS